MSYPPHWIDKKRISNHSTSDLERWEALVKELWIFEGIDVCVRGNNLYISAKDFTAKIRYLDSEELFKALKKLYNKRKNLT